MEMERMLERAYFVAATFGSIAAGYLAYHNLPESNLSANILEAGATALGGLGMFVVLPLKLMSDKTTGTSRGKNPSLTEIIIEDLEKRNNYLGR